jgi:hypothetical protein
MTAGIVKAGAASVRNHRLERRLRVAKCVEISLMHSNGGDGDGCRLFSALDTVFSAVSSTGHYSTGSIVRPIGDVVNGLHDLDDVAAHHRISDEKRQRCVE